MVKQTEQEIDLAIIANMKNLTPKQKRIMLGVSEQMWFRGYAKKSKKQLNKLLKKVKAGVKEGKYGTSPKFDTPTQGYEKPREQQYEKPKVKAKPKRREKKVRIEKPKTGKAKIRRDKLTAQSIIMRAPSGRKYSMTELREGVGSKRAKQYREKHNIDINDYAYR